MFQMPGALARTSSCSSSRTSGSRSASARCCSVLGGAFGARDDRARRGAPVGRRWTSASLAWRSSPRRAIGLLIVLVVDTIVLGAFYRIVSGIRIPLRLLVPGTLHRRDSRSAC